MAGATPHPVGVAAACGGSIFVAESTSGLARVERFGEPGSLQAFCPPPEKSVLRRDPGPPDPGPPPAPPGDSTPPATVAPVVPSNAIVLGAGKRDRRRGTASLAITVPAAGRLTVAGRGIRAVARTLTAAATVTVPIRLFGEARRSLLANGHRRVTATITFAPTGGSPGTETRKLTLVKQQQPPQPRRR